MKKLLFLSVLFIAIVSCDDKDDTQYANYLVATPLKTNLQTFKEEAIAVTSPEPIMDSGKIYAYKNYIFVNDIGRGFHVIDNSDPTGA